MNEVLFILVNLRLSELIIVSCFVLITFILFRKNAEKIIKFMYKFPKYETLLIYSSSGLLLFGCLVSDLILLDEINNGLSFAFGFSNGKNFSVMSFLYTFVNSVFLGRWLVKARSVSILPRLCLLNLYSCFRFIFHKLIRCTKTYKIVKIISREWLGEDGVVELTVNIWTYKVVENQFPKLAATVLEKVQDQLFWIMLDDSHKYLAIKKYLESINIAVVEEIVILSCPLGISCEMMTGEPPFQCSNRFECRHLYLAIPQGQVLP